MMKKIVSIRFDENDLKKLRAMAKRMRVTVSSVIRLKLAEVLENKKS